MRYFSRQKSDFTHPRFHPGRKTSFTSKRFFLYNVSTLINEILGNPDLHEWGF
jgi:hypothetical protein